MSSNGLFFWNNKYKIVYKNKSKNESEIWHGTEGLAVHLNQLHQCWKYGPLEAGWTSSLLPTDEQRRIRVMEDAKLHLHQAISE